MRTLLVDTDRLGPVLLRQAPQRLERDGSPVVSADGEAVYLGRLVLPGGARSVYADTASPREVRLKTLGSDRGLTAGLVQLGGRVTLTAWYTAGRRGPGLSELTVSAEHIDPAPAGSRATVSGWLPVRPMTVTADDPLLVLDQVPLDSGGWRVFLAMPEASIEGLAEVVSTTSAEHLVGQLVTVDLSARLVVPDREDVGRSAKAQFVLMGTNWAPYTKPNAKPARPVTTSEAA